MPSPTKSACARAGAYRPRLPDQTVLYDVVRDQLETFLARAREVDRVVPRFVERELRRYLKCGILAHGFLRVYCHACRHDRLVPFSCKGRGFCPSCGGRHMAETAAFLVDHVIPKVAVRQWVLSVPVPLRYRMAYDAELTTRVLEVFTRARFLQLLSMSLSPCCPYHPAEVACRIGQAAPVHAAFARQQWARPSELNLSGPPVGSLALRPGDSLTAPWAALSISFRNVRFPSLL